MTGAGAQYCGSAGFDRPRESDTIHASLFATILSHGTFMTTDVDEYLPKAGDAVLKR